MIRNLTIEVLCAPRLGSVAMQKGRYTANVLPNRGPSPDRFRPVSSVPRCRNRRRVQALPDACWSCSDVEVFLRAEQLNMSIGSTVSLQALKGFLAVMEDIAGRGEGEVAEGDDLGIVPAVFLIPVHCKHMVGKDFTKTKLRILRFLFRAVCQLNFDFHDPNTAFSFRQVVCGFASNSRPARPYRKGCGKTTRYILERKKSFLSFFIQQVDKNQLFFLLKSISQPQNAVNNQTTCKINEFRTILKAICDLYDFIIIVRQLCLLIPVLYL